MLPPEAGIPLIRRELTARRNARRNRRRPAPRGPAERMGRNRGPRCCSRGGCEEALASKRADGRQDRIRRMSGGFTVETTLDPKVQPFLHDHQIDGTPVLPGVMGIEAFAEAAPVCCPRVAALRPSRT